MAVFVLGLVLWCGVHLMPALAPDARAALVNRLGMGPYKGLFALLIVASLALIVTGWGQVEPVQLYAFGPWAWHANNTLMVAAIALVVAGNLKTRLRTVVRHPMLVGVKVWGIAHLLVNGDHRSLILFGVMILWAAAEMSLINRREGPREKPQGITLKHDIIWAVASLVLLVVIMLVHLKLGVSPILVG